jgi:hypothetical protein
MASGCDTSTPLGACSTATAATTAAATATTAGSETATTGESEPDVQCDGELYSEHGPARADV